MEKEMHREYGVLFCKRNYSHRVLSINSVRSVHFSVPLCLNKEFMLVRLVRMTFQEDKLTDFHALFDQSKHHIRAFPGNRHLELLSDPDNPAVRITYSLWNSASDLEAYRQSELFRTTWAATKVLFAEKPVAFSGERLEEVNG